MSYMNRVSGALDRRFSPRVRVEMFLNQYVRDLPFRALATNLSPWGLQLRKLVERNAPLSRIVGVEFELPGTGELIWARAEPRFDALDSDFQTSGLLFTAMASKHERLLRAFVRRKQDCHWWRFDGRAVA